MVRGHVVGWEKLVPQVYAEAMKNDARHYSWREPSPTVKLDFRKLTANVARDVCIVASIGGAAASHEPISVKVTGGRITPSTIAIAPGSRLSLKNADPFVHVLYEVGSSEWAPNPVAAGSAREWSSSTAGVHVIRDQLFPSVAMYIVIDPSVVEYALPDKEGAFAIALPAGEYTLKALFEGKQVGKDSIRVGGGGLEVKEPMTLAPGGDSK
jgi:hypothetical protein